MANGRDIWFWEIGLANPRLVAGFFAPADLEWLQFLRQNGRALEATTINSSIVERSYQHEAIRRVAEAFAANKRRAVLVMATGTGKTRVAMALIDVFLRANQAQNVLFLADRDALVDQTLTDDFKAHLNWGSSGFHARTTDRPQAHFLRNASSEFGPRRDLLFRGVSKPGIREGAEKQEFAERCSAIAHQRWRHGIN